MDVVTYRPFWSESRQRYGIKVLRDNGRSTPRIRNYGTAPWFKTLEEARAACARLHAAPRGMPLIEVLA